MIENENMVMPVGPLYGGAGNGGIGNGFGGDWAWIILLLLLGWGNNGNGGFGGNNGGGLYPWLNQSENVSNGFQNLSTQICNGFSEVQQSMAANQMANMQQAFAAQTAVNQGFNSVQNQLANCCCENRAGIADLKYTVATENCADRAASYQNTRDIIDSQNRGTQAILDKLCQLELDGVKAQVEAKNDRIAELQTQLNMANLAASQTAQNALIQQGFANEVDQLYNRLNNCPVPSTPVYGRTPIFTCNQNNGCGCSGNGFING